MVTSSTKFINTALFYYSTSHHQTNLGFATFPFDGRIMHHLSWRLLISISHQQAYHVIAIFPFHCCNTHEYHKQCSLSLSIIKLTLYLTHIQRRDEQVSSADPPPSLQHYRCCRSAIFPAAECCKLTQQVLAIPINVIATLSIQVHIQ